MSVDILLSDPYTSDDVNNDIQILLNYWNLADDTQIPWRTDGLCTSGPMMSYMEGPAVQPNQFEVTGGACGQGALPACDGTGAGTFTPSGGCTEYTYDCAGNATYSHVTNAVDPSVAGIVLGAPLPAGSDPYWDFRLPNYDVGDPTIQSWGAYAPTWAPNATQWTPLPDTTALLPGAFMAFNSLQTNFAGEMNEYYGGFLVASKYAEVRGAPHEVERDGAFRPAG